MEHPLFVRAAETAEGPTIDEHIRYVRRGYHEQGAGVPVLPRQRLEADGSAELMSYLTILPDLGVMGGYVYSSSQDQWYLTPLFDAESGELLGIVDGSALSPFKTAAASGVAVDELARADATELLLFGSGPQAQSQAKAVASVRDIDTVRILSLSEPEAAELASTLEAECALSATVIEDADSHVPQADIIVTATRASEPLFDGELVRPGTHITAMGQSSLNKREIDSRVISEATYVGDSKTRCLEESGEFNTPVQEGLIGREQFHAELGDIVAGNAPGRESPEEITVFDSGGTAVETVASACLVLEWARSEEQGQPLPVSSLGDAPTRI